ncbi:hypothetical protein [Vreelandella populi]|uniref:Uncharacterized protein n=1 Tax=Vreelandella populi TaxID=2498858 RepID=A0A433L7T6_9GAMM|nr:hypothetical protein [Halomonas populi]RUR43437.1 hypothetical protein ELY37_17180 [Halomonas populi]
MIKSSPNSRRQAIVDALVRAHESAMQLCGTSLNRMPEYYMAMRVADYFADNFLDFGYRLEPQVKRTFQNAHLWHQEAESLRADPDIRHNGRFDLVLYNNKRERPAHVIEFKRGAKLDSLRPDIKRLARVCFHAGHKSLETNYLVLTRKCPKDSSRLEESKQVLSEELDGIEGVSCKVTHSGPLTPFINRDYETVADATFRIWVIEIKAL